MKNRKNVLILFGGVSSEHEVSRASASSILNHISREKYEIYAVGITKAGNWILTDSPAASIADGSWEQDPANRSVAVSMDQDQRGLVVMGADGSAKRIPIDVVFPVLHGKNGEDGTMQGLLQITGIPFVGSDMVASAASMDKAITKVVVEQAGWISQADSVLIHERKYREDPNGELLGVTTYFSDTYPLFVKPANAGSSVGISKVKSADELPEALEAAFAEDDKVLVEEAVTGRELEVAILGNEKPEASCIGEIFAANEFYDYNAKYENTASQTAIVTDLDPEKEQEIKDTAVKVYRIMGCRGLARVDFFLKDSGRIVFNEINTMPGFTDISMYPQLWEASGISYPDLIDRLIRLALEQ